MRGQMKTDLASVQARAKGRPHSDSTCREGSAHRGLATLNALGRGSIEGRRRWQAPELEPDAEAGSYRRGSVANLP